MAGIRLLRHCFGPQGEHLHMRLALITGGSSGLGLALCRALERRDFQIMAFSRRAPYRYSVQLDLADPLACAATIDRVLVEMDPQQVSELLLINNAGSLTPIGVAADVPASALIENLNVNLTSAVVVLSRVMGHFQRSQARKLVANISSGAAQRAFAGWSLYCAAKAGMEQHIRALAMEQAPQPWPWMVVNISPGVMDTAMQAQIRASRVEDFPAVGRFVERQARGELRDVETVARAVLRIIERQDLMAGERYLVDEHLD
jgi:benzil reductase ((S)-benzoin forming)